MNSIQQLIDEFNQTAGEVELSMQRVERKAPCMNVDQYVCKLEHCRSIVHQLITRVNGKSHLLRHLPRSLDGTNKLLQELTTLKSALGDVVRSVLHRFLALEDQFTSRDAVS